MNCNCCFGKYIDCSSFSNFIFVGDFNLDFLNHSHPLHFKLSSVLSTFSLSQIVQMLTHTSPSGNSTLIDLVPFVPPSTEVESCSVVPPIGNSDHNGIMRFLKQKSSSRDPNNSKRLVWRYAQANWPFANSLLFKLDVNRACTRWEERFMAIIEECIPQSRLPKKRNFPWISKEVLTTMRRRNKCFKKAQRNGDHTSKERYKDTRNKALKMLRR